ncbi:uncharacterized protein LOC133482640 isoform X1 [Phyllopteryx taeniolatus]|uniref:uncharacterized protein LOC133482640 isoform X1 n=1 Tax=Phyllopteryx taeniolatus TaxID=161469 RepID=UPI002AD50199|nr:uncharacterized protein LOC133482640 isoform X1 [Phyllopteryx taeniolatus]
MEAIFIELCYIHAWGRSLAGIRMRRWGLVLRDYGRIKQICRSVQLLAAAPIQLVEVNHRTLTQWYNRRSKEELVRSLCVSLPVPTADQVAAEALPPSKPLLEKPVQPSKGLEYNHPYNTSGLAVTHKGLVLPELFAARASASSSSSTSVAAVSASSSAAGETAAASAAARIRLREEQIRAHMGFSTPNVSSSNSSTPSVSTRTGSSGPKRRNATQHVQALWKPKVESLWPQSLQERTLLLSVGRAFSGRLAR